MDKLDKKLQEVLNKKMKNNDLNFENKQIDIYKEAERMRNILRDEISQIKSTTTGLAFLDHINIDKSVKVINGELTIGITFDGRDGDDGVHRHSLYPSKYPNGAYLPYIFNNGYDTNNKRIWGFDRHGFYIGSRTIRLGNHFMQRAIDKFNINAPIGVRAEMNKNYDGGIFDDEFTYY